MDNMNAFFELARRSGIDESDYYSPEFARDLAFGKLSEDNLQEPPPQIVETVDKTENINELSKELDQLNTSNLARNSFNLLNKYGRYRGV